MARKRGEKCQTRAYSIVDELFTVVERWRIVNLLAKEVEAGRLEKRFGFLDVGCYCGSMYFYLEQGFMYPRYVGVDAREDYVERARQTVPPGRSWFATVDVGDAEAMAKFADKFDVVACMQVLEHLGEEKLFRALGLLRACVKRGGLLILTMPTNTLKSVFHKLEKEKSMEHVYFPVHEDIRHEMADWDQVEVLGAYSLKSGYRIPTSTRRLEPWCTMAERLGSRVMRAVYMATRDEQTGGGWYVYRRPNV